MISTKLKDETYLDQIKQCASKSKNEVQNILAMWEPKPDVKDSIRHMKTEPKPVEEQASVAATPENSDGQFRLDQEKPQPTREAVTPLSVERICLRFSIDAETESNLKRAQELLSTQGLGELFAKLLNIALDAKDPCRREARRQQKARRKAQQIERNEVAAVKAGIATDHQEEKPAQVSQKLKDQLLQRAGYQCAYVGPAGQRCGQRKGLEVEHIRPRAKGGANERENLTILCKAHNLYQAEKHFGLELIREKITRGRHLRSG
jgi:5-methylcytosine-specific restriction endonuclease McrA